MTRCCRFRTTNMRSCGARARGRRSSANATASRPNACCRPSGSINACSAISLNPWTVKSSGFFIPDFSIVREGRIFAGQSFRSARLHPCPAMWRWMCPSAAGGLMATIAILRFAGVILHVIWDGDRDAFQNPAPAGVGPAPDETLWKMKRKPVTLALRHVLDAPVSALSLWLNSETVETLPNSCAASAAVPCGNFPPGNCRSFSGRRRRSGSETRPARCRPARGTQAGSRHCGRVFSARWGINTTAGRCIVGRAARAVAAGATLRPGSAGPAVRNRRTDAARAGRVPG